MIDAIYFGLAHTARKMHTAVSTCQRIRGIAQYALYKFTIYLLTYLLRPILINEVIVRTGTHRSLGATGRACV